MGNRAITKATNSSSRLAPVMASRRHRESNSSNDFAVCILTTAPFAICGSQEAAVGVLDSQRRR